MGSLISHFAVPGRGRYHECWEHSTAVEAHNPGGSGQRIEPEEGEFIHMHGQPKHQQTRHSWWKKMVGLRWLRKIAPSRRTKTKETFPNQNQTPEEIAARIRPEDYEDLYTRLGYRFHDPTLLRQSLTHRSFMNESGDPAIEDNEKLEFLGDSIIGFVISELLYRSFPRFREGDLSRVKSHVVSEAFLANIARELDLGAFLLLGKGEAASGGHEKNSLLSNCYEAVVAALYLDGGIQPTWDFLIRCFKERVETLIHNQHILDHKSLLQERSQELFNATPRYRLRQIIGPDHDRTFEIELLIKGDVFSVGKGKNKKEAEQLAAKAALAKLNINTGKIRS
ncbi:ribonuclease III [candidate division KSB3 bacterium]|uniref:Ribonuclease 3 n=1 Tax=candidate division KSB3 bacterium TaxID=2044937 RepID=A0A9D5JW70_9BACT|nr:ribonuclease III [candidate division KSB3 bacterium]MBD3325250.1 ribonuclease III [candidate division KSB3 bacterium]